VYETPNTYESVRFIDEHAIPHPITAEACKLVADCVKQIAYTRSPNTIGVQLGNGFLVVFSSKDLNSKFYGRAFYLERMKQQPIRFEKNFYDGQLSYVEVANNETLQIVCVLGNMHSPFFNKEVTKRARTLPYQFLVYQNDLDLQIFAHCIRNRNSSLQRACSVIEKLDAFQRFADIPKVVQIFCPIQASLSCLDCLPQ
jgi:hypothetical protein